MLIETFGFSPKAASIIALGITLLCAAAIVWVVRTAPPRQLVLTTGPEGGSYERWALAYQKALAVHGVTLEIRPSAGSLENLKRLQLRDSGVDIGFVAGGVTTGEDVTGLVSLGSVAYQPVWVFYRGTAPLVRLSELAGRHIAIGSAGSATRTLALALLQANGITGAPTVFEDLDANAATAALLEGKLDAVFMMGDSASIQNLRSLLRSPDVRLFDFEQADAYVRRFAYLNKMVLPEGAIDLGKGLPAQNVTLLAPTVELVARENLNSALSDLLLEVARGVHSRASTLQKRGEFPAPLEHDLTVSEDAKRYYKSGLGFTYRYLHSFWLANLVNRTLVAALPLILLLIPALRILPVAYRWNIRLRFYRCYRPLLRVERDAYGPLTPERVAELLKRLDEIQEMVDQVKVPASFADQYYELRGYVVFVRQKVEAAGQRPA